VEVTAEAQETFVNDSYQSYRARVREETLKYEAALRELLETNDADKKTEKNDVGR
jgi:hypothetical protein